MSNDKDEFTGHTLKENMTGADVINLPLYGASPEATANRRLICAAPRLLRERDEARKTLQVAALELANLQAELRQKEHVLTLAKERADALQARVARPEAESTERVAAIRGERDALLARVVELESEKATLLRGDNPGWELTALREERDLYHDHIYERDRRIDSLMDRNDALDDQIEIGAIARKRTEARVVELEAVLRGLVAKWERDGVTYAEFGEEDFDAAIAVLAKANGGDRE